MPTLFVHPLTSEVVDKLNALLADWHEAGRAAFEQRYPHTSYDADMGKRLIVKRKYLYLDEGTSGVWMVERATGEVFSIKGYGVPDRKKRLGTLDTITGADLHRLRWWYKR